MTTTDRPPPPCRLCGAGARTLLTLPETPATVQTLHDPNQVGPEPVVTLTLARCPRCGLVQLVDDPDVGRLYSVDYLCSVNFSAHARAYQDDLARRWARDHDLAGRRVLEVGGGDGFFAALLTGLGCDVTLIDPAPRACHAARARGLGRVVEGYLTPGTFPGETFDAVLARHVLEHVARPVAFLDMLRGYLGPEGKAFIEVPNLDGIVKNQRYQDFYSEHVSYFDPRSLATAFDAAGFVVEELATIERGDYLVGVGRAGRGRLDAMLDDAGSFVAQFRALAEESRRRGRRLAVWGAGGRCVALLARVRTQDLGIRYVVDSDPKKWGLVTPATHLPIVGPERLRAEPVDDLLIAATAFQDEIARDLAWFRGEGRRLGLVQPAPHWLDAAEAPGEVLSHGR